MTEDPIIEHSQDDTLGDGILLAFIYAAFLDGLLRDTHEAASTCMTRAQTLFEDMLREATAHSEPNINIIFARNPKLQTTFYNLFIDSCFTFAEQTRASIR